MLLRLPAAILVPAAVLFGGAGTWRWPAAWAYLALLVTGILGSIVVLLKFQPGLAEERARWREGARWDKPFLTIIGVIGPLAVQLVCALDKRFEWSAAVTAGAKIVAGVLLAGGIAIALWAMAVNPFFSATVRIQTDRGHTVIDRGPYRCIRHPGYAGMVVTTLAGPPLLGTLWGFVPAALLVAAMVVRTALEDRTLHAGLAGYAEYAARVRFRIVPPVW